jgi:hypothetical protein
VRTKLSSSRMADDMYITSIATKTIGQTKTSSSTAPSIVDGPFFFGNLSTKLMPCDCYVYPQPSHEENDFS